MAKKIRVYELARELGLTNKETLDLCAALGIGVKSHSSSIEDAQADRVRRKADREGLRREVQPEEPAPAKKTKKAAPRRLRPPAPAAEHARSPKRLPPRAGVHGTGPAGPHPSPRHQPPGERAARRPRPRLAPPRPRRAPSRPARAPARQDQPPASEPAARSR